MGDYPSRSTDATAGGPGVTGRHARSAGTGVSPSSNEEPPIGGGGALQRKARFSMETGFKGLSVSAGAMVLVIIVAIAIFLISKAVPALHANQANFLTDKQWFPNDAQPKFGIAAIAFGTVLSSVIALIAAVPIALGIALFLSHYAPKRVASSLGFMIDLEKGHFNGRRAILEARAKRLTETLRVHAREIEPVVGWARKVAEKAQIPCDLPYPLLDKTV